MAGLQNGGAKVLRTALALGREDDPGVMERITAEFGRHGKRELIRNSLRLKEFVVLRRKMSGKRKSPMSWSVSRQGKAPLHASFAADSSN
jgi:hypothetical protein